MTEIGAVLRWIFGHIVYPVLVLGVFAFISKVIADFVLAVAGERRIRRLVAAALPLTVLVFALVDAEAGGIQELLEVVGPWFRFASGMGVGVLVLAIGRALSRRDTEIAAAVYVMFLSAIGSFIVYCFVEYMLRSLHVFLLGLVLGGGLYVVFRGAPTRPRRTHEKDSSDAGADSPQVEPENNARVS